MNTTAWQDFRHIWTATTSWRDRRTCLWTGRVALFLALTAGMGRLAGVIERDLFWKLELGIAMLWFGVLWVFLFVPASVLMNSAPNAALVPRLRGRLLQMAGSGLMILVIGGTIASGNWKFLPLIHAYVLGFMLMRAGVRLAMLLIMLPFYWPAMTRYILPEAVVAALSDSGAVVVENTALMLLAAWCLVRLYPAGGDRHLDGRARQLGNIRCLERREVTTPAQGASWSTRLAYLPSLRRACRGREPAALLMHALGPVAHWSAWGIVPVVAAAVALALRLAPLLSGHPVPQATADWLAGFSASTITILVLFSTAHVGQQLARTRGEQALVRLTPLAGQAALLNRRLAFSLLKSFFASWAMMTASVLVLAWAVGAGPDGLLRNLALSCLGGEVALIGLLRDYARETPKFSLSGLLWAFPVGAVNFGLAYALAQLGGPRWLWLAALSVAGAALWLRRSWTRMTKAAPAFPVGRMGEDATTRKAKA